MVPLHLDTRPAGSERNGGPSHVEPEVEPQVQVIHHTPVFTEYRTPTEAWGILREKAASSWYETRIELPLHPRAPLPARKLTASEEALVIDVMGQLAREAARDRRRAKRRLA